jgi:probable HAF family extracellular repeat protein
MRSHVLFAVVAAVTLAGPAFAQPYTFRSFDVQCPATADASVCPAGLAPGQAAAQTGARGVNAHGDIVGFYVAAGKQHGFVFTDGNFMTVDFPVAGVRATSANGINDRGEIVGQYVVPVHDPGNPPSEDSPLYCPAAADAACTKAFHFWHGQFSTLTFPATFDENGQRHAHPGAIAQRITSDGDIYGCVHDHDLGASMFGAVWTRFGTASLMSNGGELSDSMPVPMSMNNGATNGGGTIAGFYVNMLNQQHGYVVRDGMLEPYDPTSTTSLTAIWDMNTSQHFVGTYRESGEAAARRHAFVQSSDGAAAVTFDFTCQEVDGCAGGASFGTVAFATVAFGISPDGVVVGQYVIVSGGAIHAFVAIPPDTE